MFLLNCLESISMLKKLVLTYFYNHFMQSLGKEVIVWPKVIQKNLRLLFPLRHCRAGNIHQGISTRVVNNKWDSKFTVMGSLNKLQHLSHKGGKNCKLIKFIMLCSLWYSSGINHNLLKIAKIRDIMNVSFSRVGSITIANDLCTNLSHDLKTLNT